MRIKLTFSTIRELLDIQELQLPKYTSALINLANRYAQGTRPRVVGQMSDLIQEFSGKTIEEWRRWYEHGHPDAIEDATDKIWQMLCKLKNAMNQIEREMVRAWTEDLVIVQTFLGLRLQDLARTGDWQTNTRSQKA